jgi:hypothetical protein
MRQPTHTGAPAASGGVLFRLRRLFTRQFRIERRGINWRLVFEPAPRAADNHRPAESSVHRRGELPSMTTRQVAEVCANLRAVLGGEIGRHPRMPSLALLERTLLKDGERGIDDVPAAVLRHAAQLLDALELDQYGPGLVLLRRRIEQVLRRRHGDRPSREAVAHAVEHVAQVRGPEGGRDFSDSLTEFIDIDKLFGDRSA